MDAENDFNRGGHNAACVLPYNRVTLRCGPRPAVQGAVRYTVVVVVVCLSAILFCAYLRVLQRTFAFSVRLSRLQLARKTNLSAAITMPIARMPAATDNGCAGRLPFHLAPDNVLSSAPSTEDTKRR